MPNITPVFDMNKAKSSRLKFMINSIMINNTRPQFILIAASVVALSSLGIAGCGQKGDLYLVDASSQTVTDSSDVLDSTSNPQDAAFAGIDDSDYQKERYLEQKQVLADVTNDPNDY